ncbi:MAG: hypothetical protein RR313_10575 [Anaerovoracaceae bacterium]
MRLIEFGKKGLLFKICPGITIVLKNYKLESLIIVLGIIWIIQPWPIPALNQMLEDYLVESRCSGIAGFASVVIGIYITVWSIFATSASKINIELLKKKVEGQLFFFDWSGFG